MLYTGRQQCEDGTRPVVYLVSELQLQLAPVSPTDEVRVSSGFMLQNEMFVCVQQVKPSSGRNGQP